MIFELATNLEAAGNIDVAMDMLQDSVAKLGFPTVDYAFVPKPRLPNGQWAPPPLKTRNFPNRWDVQWDRHRAHDPYYHACFQGKLIVNWADVQRGNRLGPEEADCWNYLADKGLSRGLTVPIHMPSGSFAFISAIGDISDDDWNDTVSQHQDDLFAVAHYFSNTVYIKFNRPIAGAHRGPLSPREAECLSWAAQGKTAEDIATILGLSIETVRIHLKRVCSRLNAVNRSHAVAKAVYLGFIDVPL